MYEKPPLLVGQPEAMDALTELPRQGFRERIASAVEPECALSWQRSMQRWAARGHGLQARAVRAERMEAAQHVGGVCGTGSKSACGSNYALRCSPCRAADRADWSRAVADRASVRAVGAGSKAAPVVWTGAGWVVAPYHHRRQQNPARSDSDSEEEERHRLLAGMLEHPPILIPIGLLRIHEGHAARSLLAGAAPDHISGAQADHMRAAVKAYGEPVLRRVIVVNLRRGGDCVVSARATWAAHLA